VTATAAPNKIPRVNARRSISFIERFLPRVARPTHSRFSLRQRRPDRDHDYVTG
jgi:hypothetical protein